MKKLSAIYFVLFVFLVASRAWAASGGDGVPQVVLFQFINFSIFIGLLVFLLRKKVSAFFTSRVTDFRSQFEKSKAAKETAEAALKDIKGKLKEISLTEGEVLKKAESDANGLKAQILSDAAASALKIKEDTTKSIELEYYKANEELRRELLDEVLLKSKTSLKSDIKDDDQTRLRNEFVEGIQAVQ